MKAKKLLALVVLLLGSAFLSVKERNVTAQAPPPGEPVVARVGFGTQEQLRWLASVLDVWEVHSDQGYLLAYVQPDQYAALISEGYSLQIENRLSAFPDTIPGDSCYRTIDELDQALKDIAAQHPNLAQLIRIGSSFEGRPLQVLRLTNRDNSVSKPVFFLMANIHGRELITPEAAMAFADDLVGKYGVEAEATWLLDDFDIQVLVSANPDGHVRNEAGQPWTYWRKNTQPYGSCAPNFIGVDLNRNFAFHWGCCGGSSSDACAETYRGPVAASEPETQAIQSYLASIFPDQRGAADGDAAPQDATGVLLTLHSYGDLVLWPWGWTDSPAPNAEGLAALGRKLAGFNGYTPQQSNYLYPTDGSTDDWSYGELGIASYTFEMGSNADGFYPSCSRYDALIDPNLQAFRYAAKVAGTPYLTVQGPDALGLSLEPASAGDGLILRATLDDAGNGGQAIAAAEVYLDLPPWAGGVPLAMQPNDGAFDSPQEQAQVQIPGSVLGAVRHTLLVRGEDSAGNWGPFSAVFSSSEPQIDLNGPPGPVAPGEAFTYTLTLTHTFPITLTGLVVTDTLPAGLTFVSASSSGNLEGEQVRWSDLELPPQGQIRLEWVARALAEVPSGTLVTNSDYGAKALQMPVAILGKNPVITLVLNGSYRIYFPFTALGNH